MSEQPIIVYTDRSRALDYQRCHLSRYFQYHYNEHGIVSVKLNIPLATGIYEHDGLAELLRTGDVEKAVQVATDHYWAEIRKRGLQLEPGEDAAHVADEQTALVEGMLRAYHIVRYPILIGDFHVVEVERDEAWKIFGWTSIDYKATIKALGKVTSTVDQDVELWFQSRLDALLIEKCSGDLYIQSYKTSASWDSRRAKDAEHDMQGLSELATVEFRLYQWWKAARADANWTPPGLVHPELLRKLRESADPPKVQGVRMEYLLKGDRYEYPKGSGTKVQYSPLIRGYCKYGVTPGDNEYGWKQSWTGDDGKDHRLPWQTWKAFHVFEKGVIGGVKEWIDLLATGTVQPEAGPCLESQFITPIPYFRQEDDVRDWYEQIVAQERQVWEDLQELARADTEGGKRTVLNRLFPQYRRSCHYPTDCPYVDVCYGTNIRANPVGSGLYQIRTPHHDAEKDVFRKKGWLK